MVSKSKKIIQSKPPPKKHTPVPSPTSVSAPAPAPAPAPSPSPVTALYDASYNNIRVQNLSLQNAIKEINENSDLDQSLFLYKTNNLPIMGNILYFLTIIYGIAFIVFAIIIGLTKKIGITVKILLILLFLGYPFLIFSIENGLCKMAYFVYSVLNGESYTTTVDSNI